MQQVLLASSAICVNVKLCSSAPLSLSLSLSLSWLWGDVAKESWLTSWEQQREGGKKGGGGGEGGGAVEGGRSGLKGVPSHLEQSYTKKIPVLFLSFLRLGSASLSAAQYSPLCFFCFSPEVDLIYSLSFSRSLLFPLSPWSPLPVYADITEAMRVSRWIAAVSSLLASLADTKFLKSWEEKVQTLCVEWRNLNEMKKIKHHESSRRFRDAAPMRAQLSPSRCQLCSRGLLPSRIDFAPTIHKKSPTTC